MDKFETIALIIYSVLAFLVGKEFFLPQLNKLYKWLKNEKNETEDRTFQVGEEVHKMKMNDVEYYEKTFETLLNQISDLENQLNSKLYQKSLIISEVQNRCCSREDCKDRIACKNFLCDVIDNEDEEDN